MVLLLLLLPVFWCAAGIKFDQDDLAVRLGEIQLMEAGQPLAFDAKTASKYLKDTCAKHGTVNIHVSIGKGPGKGVLGLTHGSYRLCMLHVAI